MVSIRVAKQLTPALFDAHKSWLIFFVLVLLISGDGHLAPEATVNCYDDHTVDILISNVDDADEWVPSEWELENNPICGPTINDAQQTVNYANLFLPDCAFNSIQGDDYIKYILKIEAKKGNPGQLRAYDHLYYVTCLYDNQNRSMTSFVPIVNRNDNDTGIENKVYYYILFFFLIICSLKLHDLSCLVHKSSISRKGF